MVTCGEQRLFSALFSSAEKISILSTGDTRAEIACSAGVFWAGDSLFNYVCIVVAIKLLLPAGYWNGEYRKSFAAIGIVLSKRVFNIKGLFTG